MALSTHTQDKKNSNYLLLFARIFVGLLFIFSGLIKANDPVGFGYKLQEYWHVFGTDFLNAYSSGIAITICAFEILLGGLLLLGFYRKTVAWGLLLLILFFTFLTFYSAFFEVVTSCGCFGDAIPLTPWQSFIKDLVLLALILIIFIYRKDITPITYSAGKRFFATAILVLVSFGIGIYTYYNLPIIDFLPYKKGANIPELMTLPEGADPDEYETIYALKHKNTGEEKRVSDKVYLAEEIWKDDNWEIVGEPESRLVKAGYQIPITDLQINDANGEDRTDEIIRNPYHSLIIVAWNLEELDYEALARLNDTAKQAAEQYNIRAVLLTSGSAEDADYISNELGLLCEVFYADAVPLKSMVRANPGVLLMQNGVILNKWHHQNSPDFETLEKDYFSKGV